MSSGEPEIVRLTSAGSGPEAEMIQTMLANSGIRSLVRRTAAFDVPEFLAAGPREILVRAEDRERAAAIVESHFGLR